MLDQPPRQVTRTAMVDDSYNGVLSIRRGDWKWILGQHGGGAGSETIANDPAKPPGQLFHLGRDLGEAANQYEQHPEIVDALKNLIEQYRAAGRSAPNDRRRPE